jgi:hypothetical protein
MREDDMTEDQELTAEERVWAEGVKRVLLRLEAKGQVERGRNANGETVWRARLLQ